MFPNSWVSLYTRYPKRVFNFFCIPTYPIPAPKKSLRLVGASRTLWVEVSCKPSTRTHYVDMFVCAVFARKLSNHGMTLASIPKTSLILSNSGAQVCIQSFDLNPEATAHPACNTFIARSYWVPGLTRSALSEVILWARVLWDFHLWPWRSQHLHVCFSSFKSVYLGIFICGHISL